MIAKAPFGSTGHESTRTIFSAAALSHVCHADAERTLELLLEHGVNHIDTAASYGDAELRIASWLKRHPTTFFVATKTDGPRSSRRWPRPVRTAGSPSLWRNSSSVAP